MRADRTCEKQLTELAVRAAQTGVPQWTGFLSPAEQAEAEICARQAGIALHTWGGAENAERRVAAFAEADWEAEWPITCLHIAWRGRYGSLGHRDLLGAILALGIERANVGDILVGEGEAHAFVLSRMAGYLEANLNRAGSTAITVRAAEEAMAAVQQDGTPVRATVASVRLDAVTAAVWHLARTRAAELIAQGRVQVDHCQEMRPDRQLDEGATISVRGLGRAKLDQVGGKTKKNRIGVTLTRY